jgi:hypothetical protein
MNLPKGIFLGKIFTHFGKNRMKMANSFAHNLQIYDFKN